MMGVIDLIAVIIVCVTVIALYLLERGFLATMRTDAAMHARNAHDAASRANGDMVLAAKAVTLADQHAQRAFASAERATTAADKERAKIEARLASLEARLR